METFLVYCFVCNGGAALIYGYIKYREREIKDAAAAAGKIQFQFQVLGNQVNPHFYSTALIHLSPPLKMTPKSAVDYVEHLSEFFRNIVNYRDKDIISLGEEISLLNNYFYLQQKVWQQPAAEY